MFVHVVSTLLPVFTVLLLGYVLVRVGFIKAAFVEEMNHLIYWVALPALIVGSLGRSGGIPASVIPLVAAFAVSTAVFVACCGLVLKWVRFPSASRGTFLQAAYRGNLAFIAIPILAYTLRGLPKDQSDVVVSQAVFLFAPAMIFYNVIAGLIFPFPADASHRRFPVLRGIWKALYHNPLLIASFVGGCLVFLPWKLPVPVLDSLDYIGRFAGPAAVLCVGGTMASHPLGDHWRPAFVAAILKVAVFPCLSLLVALPFGLGRNETLILLIFSSAPCAAAGYVVARKMGGDGPLAASSIFISTVLCVFALSAAIAWFG